MRDGSIISIGECMVELARNADGRYGLSYGGDTFNTAVYMARAGLDVSYATRLGDDPYSDGILALAASENVGTSLIGRAKGRNAGLYLIETSPTGERSFHYWRDRAPARDLFDAPNGDAVVTAMTRARLVYLSGHFPLALWSRGSRHTREFTRRRQESWRHGRHRRQLPAPRMGRRQP